MKGRSRLVIIGTALGGFLVLLVCATVLSLGAYLILSRGVSLGAFLPALSNRIVFVGNDSNIYVVDPTGKSRSQLTKDGDGGTLRAYAFPTWAPDGRRIAYVGTSYSGRTLTDATLYSIEPTGNSLRTLYKSDQFFPFYLYWSPDSHYLTFLTSKDTANLSLRVAVSDKENSMQELESGAPLYWAWSPDSQNMFLHIGGARSDSDTAHMSLLHLDDKSTQALDSSPGAFEAPQWSPDGKQVLFSQQDANAESLAVANRQGQDVKKLFDYDGRVAFSWSPTGDRIAYIVTPADARVPTFGPVQVVDANGKNVQNISDAHVLAFVWSPNGKRLAYLDAQLGGTSSSRFKGLVQSGSGGNQLTLQWYVKDFTSGLTHPIASFNPTDSFLSTLGFFDQYARSVTYWSPDSQQFVYSNADTPETSSIWVADVTGNTPPRKVADGNIAFWSWN